MAAKVANALERAPGSAGEVVVLGSSLGWQTIWAADCYLGQGAGGMKIVRLGSRTWFLR